MKARYWEYDEKLNKIRCFLCPQFCIIGENQLGLCQTRKNIHNELIAINYAEVTSISLDPIEKKPLFHYKPGKNIISIGTFGCNMKCSFCQNYSISQFKAPSRLMEFDELDTILNSAQNNAGLSFTYNEPLMWYEYVYDTAKKIKSINPDTSIVLVTNGYVNQEPLDHLLPYIDAMNIDLKAFNPKYYQKVCKATLEPVLKTIEKAHKTCHVEITTLMVTDENDSIEEIQEIAQFLGEISPDLVLHLSRYFPTYKMKSKATDVEKIYVAQKYAKNHLNYVYVGNVEGADEFTYCPKCHEILIKRKGYKIEILMSEPYCPKCSIEIPIIL